MSLPTAHAWLTSVAATSFNTLVGVVAGSVPNFHVGTGFEQWPDWFVPVVKVVPTRDGYQVHLRGGGQFWETVLAADPDERYAVRMDRTNILGMTALMEEWRMSPTATGTRLRWTIATDGNPVYRAAVRMSLPGFARTFRTSMRLLDRKLLAA